MLFHMKASFQSGRPLAQPFSATITFSWEIVRPHLRSPRPPQRLHPDAPRRRAMRSTGDSRSPGDEVLDLQSAGVRAYIDRTARSRRTQRRSRVRSGPVIGEWPVPAGPLAVYFSGANPSSASQAARASAVGVPSAGESESAFTAHTAPIPAAPSTSPATRESTMVLVRVPGCSQDVETGVRVEGCCGCIRPKAA